MLSKGKVVNGKFDWADALMDSAISAGISTFGMLAALSVVGITSNPQQCLLSIIITAGFTFFTTLGAKRGITKEVKVQEVSA